MTAKHKSCKYTLAAALVLLLIIPCVISYVLISNLGGIIGSIIESGPNDEFDFARIFDQLKDASIHPHWLLPLLFCVAFFALSFFLLSRIRGKALRVFLNVTVALLLFCASVLCCLMLTRVNGICFCDLLGKLIPIIDKL